MTILQMTKGSAPRVEIYKDEVIVWDGEGEDQSGFLMPPDCAATIGIRLLAAAAEIAGADLPMLVVSTINAESVRLDDGEPAIRLIFMIEGAPVSAYLELTKFAEVTAEFAKASRDLDRSPRLDG